MRISLWQIYRLHCSGDDAEDLVRGYLATQHWRVDEVSYRGETITLRASSTDRPFSLAPTRATWELNPNQNETTIRLLLGLTPITLATLILIFTIAVAFEVRALFPGPIYDLIPIGIGFAVLFRWMLGSHCHQFYKEFRKKAYDETGHPATIASDGAPFASPHLFVACASAHLPVFATIACQPDAAFLFHAGFIQAIPVLLVILALIMTSKYTDDTLRYRAPYITIIVGFLVYTSWPGLYAAGEPGLPMITRLGVLCLITGGTAGFLIMAARIARTHATTRTQLEYRQPMATHGTPLGRATGRAGVILLWAVTIWTQGTALYALIKHFRSHPTPLAYAWGFPILLAYGILAYERYREHIANANDATPAPPDLKNHCAQLAAHYGNIIPEIQVTTKGHSHVRPRLLRPPVLLLAQPELDLLTTQERDALFLHELHHARTLTGLLSALQTISSVTLGARGILTILIDPRQTEFDADNAAAQVLTKQLHDGTVIVAGMVAKLSAQRLRAAQERSRAHDSTKERSMGWFLYDLLFRSGDSWYRHPTMLERLDALKNTEVTCRP